MKGLWVKYAGKIDALTLRERLMVFAAALALSVYALFALGVEPAQRQQRVLLARIQAERTQLVALKGEQQAIVSASAAPKAAADRKREALLRRIEEVDEALKALHKTLVPAQRVNLLLQEMLKRDARLQLVSLRTIAATPLIAEKAKAPAPAVPPGAAAKGGFVQNNIYKHGVEITVRGGYEDLYEYLARLEASQWRMFWDRAQLSVENHPRLTLTLTIYTLSLDKAWLEV
jgi:MSHA biogenesis protein MshJ